MGRTATYRICAAAMLAAVLVSCRSHPEPLPERQPWPVTLHDSHDTVTVESVVLDTVTVTLPGDTVRQTVDTTVSHLESRRAVSDAKINPDGTLSHTLRDKPQEVAVPVAEPRDTVTITETKEVPVYVDKVREVERELTAWQRARLRSWPWLVALCLMSLGITFRRPLGRLLGKVLKIK